MTREEYNERTAQAVDKEAWAKVANFFGNDDFTDEEKAAIVGAGLQVVAKLLERCDNCQRWWLQYSERASECENALFLRDEAARIAVAAKGHSASWLILKKVGNGIELGESEVETVAKALGNVY